MFTNKTVALWRILGCRSDGVRPQLLDRQFSIYGYGVGDRVQLGYHHEHHGRFRLSDRRVSIDRVKSVGHRMAYPCPQSVD